MKKRDTNDPVFIRQVNFEHCLTKALFILQRFACCFRFVADNNDKLHQYLVDVFFSCRAIFFHRSMKNCAIVSSFSFFAPINGCLFFPVILFHLVPSHRFWAQFVTHSSLHLWFLNPYNFSSMRESFLSTQKRKTKQFCGKKKYMFERKKKKKKKTDEKKAGEKSIEE